MTLTGIEVLAANMVPYLVIALAVGFGIGWWSAGPADED